MSKNNYTLEESANKLTELNETKSKPNSKDYYSHESSSLGFS